MTSGRDNPVVSRAARASSRSLEAAALAGFAFALLVLVARLLFFRAPTPDAGDAAVTAWYLDTTNQRLMLTALNLTALSAIAFMWFVAVIRRRIGDRENRFFGTVFLGSAILLAGSWLTAGMAYAAPALSAHEYGIGPDSSDIALWQAAGVTVDSIIATRLEAVFIMSSTNVARLSGAFNKWVVYAGYAVGLTMILIPLPGRLATWIFPLWVLGLSSTLLVRRKRFGAASFGG